MAKLQNSDVKWYVATRKNSGAHTVRNEIYMAKYEREYERIREFDTAEEAHEAYKIRCAADAKTEVNWDKTKLQAGHIRGDIKKGSLDDEDVRAQIKREIEAEITKGPGKTRGATMGPKTKARSAAAKKAVVDTEE